MTFTETMNRAAQIFEGLGAVVLLLGLVWSVALGAVAYRRTHKGRTAYRVLREAFGGTLLLALEVLVAADLIRTVAVAPTVENVAVLGLIVLIRTFLSLSLEVEIEGVPPWRRAFVSGAQVTAQAAMHARQDPAQPDAPMVEPDEPA
ncbi:MAG: DUF1622 domain-containing protein [Actinomycetes bacterium]